MKNFDFVIKYKLSNETEYRELGLNRNYFPSNPCDEDISMEIREYLYVDLEDIPEFENYDMEQLDEVIENIEFKNGHIFDEALVIHKKIHGRDEENNDVDLIYF